MQLSKQRQTYENTKHLAKRYAQNQRTTVVIYEVSRGVYAFMDAYCDEAKRVNPIEYLSFV
jgi:hypothetical protein